MHSSTYLNKPYNYLIWFDDNPEEIAFLCQYLHTEEVGACRLEILISLPYTLLCRFIVKTLLGVILLHMNLYNFNLTMLSIALGCNNLIEISRIGL